MQDVTRLLAKTESSLLRMVIDSGGAILAFRVPRLRGALLEDRALSDTLAHRVQREAGSRGFISTDELPRYGITAQERDRLEAILEAGAEDVVIMVADRRDRAERALEIIAEELAGYQRPRFASRPAAHRVPAYESRETWAEQRPAVRASSWDEPPRPAARPAPTLRERRKEEPASIEQATLWARSGRGLPQEDEGRLPLRLRKRLHPFREEEEHDTGLDKVGARSPDTGLDAI